MSSPGRFVRIISWCWVVVWMGLLSANAADSNTNVSAKLQVSGFGLLGNREMVRLLRNFQLSGKLPATLDRIFVEDAALVILARANDEGYLRATLEVEFEMVDGSRQIHTWTNALEVNLPIDFGARRALFDLNPGRRFYYDQITFQGLEAISTREARSYFVSTDMLLRLRANRIFSPDRLQSSIAALREAYARLGYRNAMVSAAEVLINEEQGNVAVRISVHAGLISQVRSLDISIEGTPESPATERHLQPDEPFTQLWQQDLAQSLRAEQFQKGYPDTTVAFSVRNRETNGVEVAVDLSVQVRPGNLVHVGQVQLNGNQRTKSWLLQRRLSIHPGDQLNPLEAEASRQRLSQLGVFDSVRLSYGGTSNAIRDVSFDLQEAKPLSLSLIGGYGSYELLRGGVEFQHANVLGLAHSFRLRAMQSFKSSQGDASYTIPEILGEHANLFLQADGLRREELTFIREEYGGAVGIQKRVVPLKTDLSVRYDYEFLNALDVTSTATNTTGVQEARSAAMVLELNRDSRDHPLLPTKGWKMFGRTEFAATALGGNVDYQRLILGASYHQNLYGGRYVHAGVTHGMSFTWGGTDNDLPFNKRYFPGGENSVRGYQEGEASPLDSNGGQLGAETYTQVNLELEQLLTESWSLLIFYDGVGIAEYREDYPWNQWLSSVGGGLRWRTVIGPVRLEYGYNLNRRVYDPVGTLHFSIGFPF